MTNEDFFLGCLEDMTDLRHPLVVLARRMPWEQIEVDLAPALADRDRAGQVISRRDQPEADLCQGKQRTAAQGRRPKKSHSSSIQLPGVIRGLPQLVTLDYRFKKKELRRLGCGPRFHEKCFRH